MPATVPMAIIAPTLVRVPAIGPHKIAPPIMPKLIGRIGRTPISAVEMNIVVNTHADEAKITFIHA